MIVGAGDIASAIIDRPDRLYFASGVSNSSETRESEYRREAKLLDSQPRDAHLVYFSSLCVFYGTNRYAEHKRNMEFVVKEWFRTYTIIRLGAVTWASNPHTLINFLSYRYGAGLPLDIRDERRVVNTLDDFRWTLAHIPDWSCEMQVPGRLLTIRQIFDEYVLGPVTA